MKTITFKKTGGVHVAAVFKNSGELVSYAEDVGRHNAVDKVLGGASLIGQDLSKCFLALSGRLTGDIVLKAARTGIPLVVSRTGYTGELGYEVFCHPRDAPAVWDTIWDAGKAYDLTPLGLEALNMLRVEAGLIFASYEFSDQTDPFEAGIPFTVPLKTKEDDFIGKAALSKRKENPQRVLVGLELSGDEVASNGDCVDIGRNQVGEITSAVRSPILRKNVALCRIQVEHSEPGTEVEVGKLDGQQKRLPAKVVGFPFYDPTKSRVRDVPE